MKTVTSFLFLGILAIGVTLPSVAQGGAAQYTVLLADPPVGERLTTANNAVKSLSTRRLAAPSADYLRRQVRRRQAPVAEEIKALGIDVLGSARNVVNALFVRCTEEQAAEIERIPGVLRAVRAKTYRPFLDKVPEIVGRSAALRLPDGTTVTGDGIKIGILDSGLDFSHEAFQESPSDPTLSGNGALPMLDGYPKGDPEHLLFANSKVVAVRSFVHLLNTREAATSTPDDNSPLDWLGHGTAVAMAAAGNRVQSPVGPLQGIAPEARIGVYKIIGTPGIADGASSSAIIAAIDAAVEDGMDILNLSIGDESAFPWDWEGEDCEHEASRECNPDAIALRRAVTDFGLVAVVAAGNSGTNGLQSSPTFNTLSGLSSVPESIAVGATLNSRRLGRAVRIAGTSYEAVAGPGPLSASDIEATAVPAWAFDDPTGCSPYPVGAVEGRIAVVETGHCPDALQVEIADAAGAVALLSLNFYQEGGDPGAPLPLEGLEATDIPAFAAGPDAGFAFLNEWQDADAVTLSLEVAPLETASDPTQVADFSSRGPTLRQSLKPDVVAPGVVYTATPLVGFQGNSYRPSGYSQTEGTSFSAPIVAGTAALVWQARPEFSAREVASALVNTANPNVLEGESPATVLSVGAGMLDVDRAICSVTTSVPPSVSFGISEEQGRPDPQQITIRNRANEQHTYHATVERDHTGCEASVTLNGLSQAQFTLAAGQSTSISVGLDSTSCGPGTFEGRIRVANGQSDFDIVVPYLYSVGDNVPFNSIIVAGGVGQSPPGTAAAEFLGAKIIDRYGLPVTGLPVSFRVAAGEGTVRRSDAVTSQFGTVSADVEYDPTTAEQQVILEVGDLEIPFEFYVEGSAPAVTALGTAGLAGVHEAFAPGSILNLFGTDLGEFEGSIQAEWAPVSLKGTSVSFDVPGRGTSVAGRLLYVSNDRIDLQIPWELQGSESALVKVKTGFVGSPVSVGIAEVSPAIFPSPLAPMPTPAQSEPAIGWFLRGDAETITASNPAQPGETLGVVMTGNGPVEDPTSSGEALMVVNSTVHTPTVTVGGQSADVTYSSLIPGTIGVYAVGFVVPETASGGQTTVQVRINGVDSNLVGLPLR